MYIYIYFFPWNFLLTLSHLGHFPRLSGAGPRLVGSGRSETWRHRCGLALAFRRVSFSYQKSKRGSAFQLNSSENIYHLVIWRGHGKSPFFIGKPSISMGHLYHGKLLNNNQRVQVMNLQIHILEFKSVVFQRTTKKRRHGQSWKTHRLGLPENGGYSDNCHCGSKSKWTRLYRIFFCLNYKWCVFQIYLGVSNS